MANPILFQKRGWYGNPQQSMTTVMNTQTYASNNRSTLILLALILLLTAMLFYKGITPSFSSDDYVHLTKNIHFKDIKEAMGVFARLDGREYRPIVRLSLWMNYKLGSDALNFHITNVLIHLGCVLTIFYILGHLLPSKRVALFPTLIFAIHPIHTTNVNFVMGRTGMLCALFYFLCILTFLSFMKHRSQTRYLLSLLFFMLGLLTKEEAVSLPLLLFAISMFDAKGTVKARGIKSARNTALFFGIDGIYVLFRLIQQHLSPQNIAGYTDFTIKGVIDNYIKWLFGLVYPLDLYQARWIVETAQRPVIIMGVIILLFFLGVTGYVLWPSRKSILKDKLIWIAVLWFIVPLLPIMGGNAHRWYLYISSFSLSLMVVALWQLAVGQTRRRVLCVLIAGFLICCAAEVYRQADIWAEQSRISENFLEQVAQLDIPNMDSAYFANVPFGYKSAFLFTFESLEDALSLKFGKRPDLKIITHVNLNDDLRITVNETPDRINFSMASDPFAYFIFPNLQRRFESPKTSIDYQECRISLKSLSSANLVDAYQLDYPPNVRSNLFYFDGKSIIKVGEETKGLMLSLLY